MTTNICKNGHSFERSSACPVCPKCSSEAMANIFGDEFPNIGAPAFRAIDNAGIKTLRDITNYSEKELLSLHGFGPRALTMLKDALNKKRLSFTKK